LHKEFFKLSDTGWTMARKVAASLLSGAPIDVRRGSNTASIQLTSEDLRELESAAAKITVRGARYPEHLQKLVGR